MGNWWNLKFCVFVLTCVVLVNAQKDSCRTPDGETATCTPIESCKPINDILDIVPQPFPKKIRQLLRSYLCPARNRQPRVCCPSSSIPIEPPDVSNHKNINLLPENCGILYTGDRIVGGNKTKLYEYPWMALLSYRTNNGPKFKCGGSIINERYILTAAHCITNLKYPLIGIRVGEHNIDTRQDCEITKEGEKICSPAVQDLAIEETIPHPSYNTTAQTHDIGLLRVRPMDLTRENIKPICLPLDRARNYNFTGRNAVVTGWGFTETGRSSPILLQVRLPTIPHEECQTIYKNIAKINYRQVCAGGKLGFDSCGGDSGGPLQTISNLHGDSRIVQQGIVSFGPKLCGGTGLPGVYTKITHYMDWILDNMKA